MVCKIAYCTKGGAIYGGYGGGVGGIGSAGSTGGPDANIGPLNRALANINRAPQPALPRPSAGGPGHLLNGTLQVNPAKGRLIVKISPPSSGTFDLKPVFSYNSSNAGSATEFGKGWFCSYKRNVSQTNDTTVATITTGSKNILEYDGGGGTYTPPFGINNSLTGTNVGTAGFTETQPDGQIFKYNQSGQLQYIKNYAGNRWTLSHDSGGRVTKVVDPFGRRVTLAYDSSNNLKRYQDYGGRITSFLVDSTSNLR